MRNILMATVAALAIAGTASAGGLSGSISGSTRTVDNLTKTHSVTTTGYTALGRGASVAANAGGSIGSGAGQETLSTVGKNGMSRTVAGASNFAATGAIFGAGAAIAGGGIFGEGSFGHPQVDYVAGAAGAFGVGAAGGLSGTEVDGESYASNVSTGRASGTGEAAQGSFGNSEAGATVGLFVADETLKVTEYEMTKDAKTVDNNRVDTQFSLGSR